jgi:DNA-directed RNA polymerase specialized sigma24 family protein
VLKEWSPREVARTLGVSVGRVYLAKHRICGLLKKEVARLEREMVASGCYRNSPVTWVLPA